MAITLDRAVGTERPRMALVPVGSQAFWVLVAVILAASSCRFATDSFATAKNLYNITRNFTFVAIIALGMTLGHSLPAASICRSGRSSACAAWCWPWSCMPATA